MADHHSITPFPSEISRFHFGHWLSGFVDGEGCFRLLWCPVKGRHKIFQMPTARFEILLRQDDTPILEQIRSYWAAGSLKSRAPRQHAHDAARYYLSSAVDLATIVVPHFDAFPLRAKKQHDFAIWKQGVALLYQVWLRPTQGNPSGSGTLPKWRLDEREQFGRFVAQLKQSRVYQNYSSIVK